MSSVKHNEDRLRRLALSSGARVEINGSTINHSRSVASLNAAKKAPEAQAEKVAPEPKAEQPAINQVDMGPVMEMAAATKQAAEAQTLLAEQIVKAITKEIPQVNVERVKSWIFSVNRDARGLITTIEAKAR